jgi:hypothetical protein
MLTQIKTQLNQNKNILHILPSNNFLICALAFLQMYLRIFWKKYCKRTWCRWLENKSVLLLLCLVVSSFLSVFPSQGSPDMVNVSVDAEQIWVDICGFDPLLDKYGYPSGNGDGTFYPNDKFSITYNVKMAEHVTFDSIEADYDQSTFTLLDSDGWGDKVGSGSFKIASSANPGVYDFSVKAFGSTLFDCGNENAATLTVSSGGVNIDAYYTTQYILNITASSPGYGTTTPAPNQYWHNSGTPVTVTAIPYSGYLFSHWLLDNYYTNPNNNLTITMNSYHSLQAIFKPQNTTQPTNTTQTNPTQINNPQITQPLTTQSLQLSSDFEPTLSNVKFSTNGLKADAIGPVLQIDGSMSVNASMFPSVFVWSVGSLHSYVWSELVSSSNFGQRYILSKVTVKEYYMATAVVQVEVVDYDPHFTLTLAYSVPNSAGSSSYEKAFALILRYDGNGPTYNLNQRAIIEDYLWSGYAQKIPQLDSMQQSFTNFSLADFFTQTSKTQFLAYGINNQTNNQILTVDDKTYTCQDFPVSFDWPVNSNHTYNWTLQIPINENVLLFEAKSCSEWLEWQLTLAFPPSGAEIGNIYANQSLNQAYFESQLTVLFRSRYGRNPKRPQSAL